jgi:hypothetical protein
MENIIVPGGVFNYNTLVLHAPGVVNGGNHFLKINRNDNPIYIQSPKCSTKQGILKTGKKMYCDLVFTNENESFINWIEYLEEYIQKTIYENKNKWFESSLELNDIEDSFTSPFKIYKSGKFYLLRVNIPCRLGTCGLKIFKESGNETVDVKNITPETKLITIIEIQGVKCSAKSFQIELEIKQMMVLDDRDLFEKCIIKSSSQPPTNTESNKQPIQENITNLRITDYEVQDKYEMNENIHSINSMPCDKNFTKNSQPVEEDPQPPEEDPQPPEEDPQPPGKDMQSPEKDMQLPEEDAQQIEEFNINIDVLNTNESIQLKERNDVYYEMYKTALSKAKTAKLLAISSFLEAKRIKNTYMINDEDTDDDDNIDDDDDDDDNIDDDDDLKIP